MIYALTWIRTELTGYHSSSSAWMQEVGGRASTVGAALGGTCTQGHKERLPKGLSKDSIIGYLTID